MTRRRYRWDNEAQALVELDAEWTDAPRGAGAPVVDLYMDGTRATDGTDIGSRTKRREYMKRNGLADADDFKGEWAKAAKEREAFQRGERRSADMREAVARALHGRR